MTSFKEVYEFYYLVGLGGPGYAYLVTILSTLWLLYAYCDWFRNDRPKSRRRIKNAWLLYLVMSTLSTGFLIYWIMKEFEDDKTELSGYFKLHRNAYVPFEQGVKEKDEHCCYDMWYKKCDANANDYCDFYLSKVKFLREYMKNYVILGL